MQKGSKNITTKKKEIKLSASKKRLFWLITIVSPFLFLLMFELLLQVFNYGGNLELFIEGPQGYENYLRCNPKVARRYFSNEASVPTPPLQLFRKEKAENGYRIFVMGGSSTAGFPYGNNVSFPTILRNRLSKAFAEKEIEVINVAMSAVNSYTLSDLTDEVLEQSPDLILIYAGHNEFYGALGVGSVQSLGNWSELINFYLKLQSVKSFLLLKDFITWSKISISSVFDSTQKLDPSSTLMARIVSEQEIRLNGDLYNSGIKQFQENLSKIIWKVKNKNVEIILSDLVSNLKDQKPFVSIDENGTSAKKQYEEGKQLFDNEEYLEANKKYVVAKDLDALRFRAPSDLNNIIYALAKKNNIPVAETEKLFASRSENGIIGNNFILEHLHPNIEGYKLLAESFYNTLVKNKTIAENWSTFDFNNLESPGITTLDLTYGNLVVRHLKAGWPFKKKATTNLFMQKYKPKNKIEEIAFKIMKTENYNIESGHMELGEYYENNKMYDEAFSEYYSLISSIPHELEFYKRAVTILLKQKKYKVAEELLAISLKYKENYFATKWIGQIALMDKNYKKSISYLKRSDSKDAQTLFNLSRAYYSDNQWKNGEATFRNLATLAPNSDYIPYLQKIRSVAKLKGGSIK